MEMGAQAAKLVRRELGRAGEGKPPKTRDNELVITIRLRGGKNAAQ